MLSGLQGVSSYTGNVPDFPILVLKSKLMCFFSMNKLLMYCTASRMSTLKHCRNFEWTRTLPWLFAENAQRPTRRSEHRDESPFDSNSNSPHLKNIITGPPPAESFRRSESILGKCDGHRYYTRAHVISFSQQTVAHECTERRTNVHTFYAVE